MTTTGNLSLTSCRKRQTRIVFFQFQMLLFAGNLWNLSECQTRVSSMPNKSSVDEIRLRLLDTVELLFLKRIPVWIQAFSEHSQILIVGEELRCRCHKVLKSSSGMWLELHYILSEVQLSLFSLTQNPRKGMRFSFCHLSMRLPIHGNHHISQAPTTCTSHLDRTHRRICARNQAPNALAALPRRPQGHRGLPWFRYAKRRKGSWFQVDSVGKFHVESIQAFMTMMPLSFSSWSMALGKNGIGETRRNHTWMITKR